MIFRFFRHHDRIPRSDPDEFQHTNMFPSGTGGKPILSYPIKYWGLTFLIRKSQGKTCSHGAEDDSEITQTSLTADGQIQLESDPSVET
jgi:hypothetical protein